MPHSTTESRAINITPHSLPSPPQTQKSRRRILHPEVFLLNVLIRPPSPPQTQKSRQRILHPELFLLNVLVKHRMPNLSMQRALRLGTCMSSAQLPVHFSLLAQPPFTPLYSRKMISLYFPELLCNRSHPLLKLKDVSFRIGNSCE